jgi:hypothetical protein
MNFNDWLAAKGFDPETITATQKAAIETAWRAESNPDKGDPKKLPTARRLPDDDPPPSKPTDATFAAKMKAIEEEAHRQEYIRHATVQMCERYKHDPAKLKDIRELSERAIADESTDRRAFDLAMLRLDRFAGPVSFSPSQGEATNAVVEAAVCRMGGLDNIERHYDAQTLEAADRHFKKGLGLQDLLAYSARRGGWRGNSVRAGLETRDFFRAAFGQPGHDMYAGDTGPSTYSLPNILGNIANKFLRLGFDAVDQAWAQISARRSVNDFKTITTATLTGSLIYRKLAPSGEIKHGTISELAYTNKADTYAIMLGIARTDLINDDLGALTSAGRRLGRGAALKLNDVFWTVFLNNSSFFTAGNNNVVTGAGTALSSAGLKTADQKFRVQTDPDGIPLGIMPKILVVPPTLAYGARELMNSSLMVGVPASNALSPAVNIFQGAYQVVTSPYMENSAYTGYSAAAWYILADPNDMPVIEGVFLNGKDSPTVETAEADFNQLGIGMRGFLDFGFSLQEFRGGVRAAGS